MDQPFLFGLLDRHRDNRRLAVALAVICAGFAGVLATDWGREPLHLLGYLFALLAFATPIAAYWAQHSN